MELCNHREVGISGITVVGIAKGGRFKVHALGHLHILDLIIDDADRLHLHPLYLVAIETILTGAVDSTLDACSKAGTVLLVTLGLLAGTVDPFHFLLSDDALEISFTFYLDTLLAAQLINTLLIQSQEAGTGFHLAFQVAQTNMVDLTPLLVRESLHLHRLNLETSFEWVEASADWIRFSVVLDRLQQFCVLSQDLFIEI